MILTGTDFLSVRNMPRQDLSEAEMDEQFGQSGEEGSGVAEFHAQTLRYIAAQYNRPRFGSYFSPQQKFHGSNTGSSGAYKGPVEEMIENYMYIHGDQPNDAYGYMLQDPISADPGIQSQMGGQSILLPTPWEQGNDIYKLFTHLIGNFVSRSAFAKLTVDDNTRDGITKRELDRNMALLANFIKEQNINLGAGVEFNPFPEAEGAEIEQVLTYLENRPQDKTILQFLEDIKFNNDIIRKLEKVFAYVIINRIGAIEVDEDKDGYPRMNVVPPQNVIIDQRGDDDFGFNDRFGGIIEFLTPEEIFSRYSISDKDEQDEIYAMSQGNKTYSNISGWGNFNATDGYFFPWWWKEGEQRVACVKGYWRGYVKQKKGDLYRSALGKDFKKFKIDFGAELDEDFQYEVVRQGVLIGNRIVLNYGVQRRIVRNPFDKSRVVLPLLSVRPYTFGGYNKSLIDRLRPIQDKMDALEAKITDNISHDFGNVYVFVADKITADPLQFASDIKSNRFTFMQRATGEDLNHDDSRSIMEKLDMNLTSNIMNYVQLKAAKRAEMEEIASVSKIALGQQSSYVGMNTQVNTIAQNSKGVEKYFTCVMQLYADTMQYAAEKLKMSVQQNPEMERRVMTPMGIRFLKVNKKFSFMDLGVRLVLEDMITEESRSRLLMVAQAFAQNQIISPLDIVEIETAKTYTELRAYLRQALRRQEKKAAQEAMMAEMSKMQAIEAQGAQLQNLEAQKQEGQNLRHGQDLEMEGIKTGIGAAQSAAALE
jgi:hypothetical protein